jgi:hypothetical protein
MGVQERRLSEILEQQPALIAHIMTRLHEGAMGQRIFPKGAVLDKGTACVLFLMGQRRVQEGMAEPCIVFNKRSMKVRQPGDLCFPGGRLMPRLDRRLSLFLRLPFSPLRRWPYRRDWLSSRSEESECLSVFLTAGLREATEEMRLNPFGVTFLGPMSPSRLSMFGRDVYPMVVWIGRQKRFLPNWEVERVLHVPVRSFLDAGNYACYRLRLWDTSTSFPCFRHADGNGTEILWGLTYDMVVAFLEIAFSFRPPDMNSLPVIQGTLSREYLKGAVVHEGA